MQPDTLTSFENKPQQLQGAQQPYAQYLPGTIPNSAYYAPLHQMYSFAPGVAGKMEPTTQPIPAYQPIPAFPGTQGLLGQPFPGMQPFQGFQPPRTSPTGLVQNTLPNITELPCNIYAQNFIPSTTLDEIRTFFSHCGKILDVRMKFDHETHEFKGFCFVDFASGIGALRALALNGIDYKGKKIKIMISRETPLPTEFDRFADIIATAPDKTLSTGGPMRVGTQPNAVTPYTSRQSVFIHGLQNDTTVDSLKETLEKHYNDTCEVKLLYKRTGAFKNCGFAKFANEETVKRALEEKSFTDGSTILYILPAKAQ